MIFKKKEEKKGQGNYISVMCESDGLPKILREAEGEVVAITSLKDSFVLIIKL